MAITWARLVNNGINFEVLTEVFPTKGHLVYEYNPFRNYRLNKTMFEYNGEYYTQALLESEFNITPSIKFIYNGTTYASEDDFTTLTGAEKYIEDGEEKWYIEETNITSDVTSSEYWRNANDIDVSDQITLYEKGELVDFITDELSFSINNPVSIVPQYSYDGSVNLILNDGINVPRMINSRFSATGKNTYEIVDRKGNNDTNIYDLGDQFEIDTSLYKRVIKIPKINFIGTPSGGNFKIGNYHFYFKLSDADGNETDFVGESGLVSVFIGFADPQSITSGTKNENSFKLVQFLLSNLDTAYSYVYAYYSRCTADLDELAQTEYAKIDRKFLISNAGVCNMLITGYEDIIQITPADINLNYNIVDSVKALTACQNMLFLGNVHKPEIPYNELLDLSLRFLPYLYLENYSMSIDETYNINTYDKGYYDPKYIYDKTGYWGEEIYRLGIVYIMPNNELSPVFNIRGADNIYPFEESIGIDYTNNSTGLKFNDGQYSNIPIYKKTYEFTGDTITSSTNSERNYVSYNESTSYIFPVENESCKDDKYFGKHKQDFSFKGILDENVKGVVRFRPIKDTNIVYGIDIRVDDDTIQELKKYVKGYFFVRLTRIPTILALGITIGVDQCSYTPCCATADGYLNNFTNTLDKTHVTTEDINDVNYITEGFLSRYQFKFKRKSSSIWKKIGMAIGIAIAVVALAAATVITCGAAAAVAAGATIAGSISAGVAAAGTIAGTIGAAVGISTAAGFAAAAAAATIIVPIAIVSTIGAIVETRYAIGRAFSKKKLDGWNTKVPDGYYISETSDSRRLVDTFLDRLIIKDPSKVKVQGILCPDYEVNQAYYNSIFTGNTHKIGLTISQSTNGLIGHSSNYFSNDDRHFYIPSYYDMGIRNHYNFKIIGVEDDTTLTGIDLLKFRSRAGSAEEAWRYESVGEKYDDDDTWETGKDDVPNKQINSDIVRGSFGPYLAFNDTGNRFSPAETVNIYIPEFDYSKMDTYFSVRMLDDTPFYAISDRYDISNSDDNLITKLSSLLTTEVDRTCGYLYIQYRGDCYICQFTHRMHRNFNDPSAPYNDEIVDEDSWKDHYDIANTENYEKINSGDVNAVPIGTWATFKVRSSYNLNIRTLDGSNTDESAMVGHPRGYYPYNGMITEGTYKHPESFVYNKGFLKSVGDRYNFETPDVPYIKNWFGTRIMYSDVHINDAYKNGFRTFKNLNYRDYTREYGEIVKLVTLNSDIICIFEHGVARLPISLEAVAKLASMGNTQITTQNVLPENPIIISDMFGSQWADSVLKTPGKTGDSKLYIYGVDTIAKKIWKTDGETLTCISDMKVQEFLNNNITLGERELTPILGIRNVKTCYNAFKRDVMFTFYDNTYGFEEKVWNLCYNELLEKFITFYSWVPSFMENINNVPFSFDRNVSKWIAKLGTSHSENSFADGITLTNVVINNTATEDTSESATETINTYNTVDNYNFDFSYTDTSGNRKTITINLLEDSGIYKSNIDDLLGFVGVLSLSNRTLPSDSLYYTIDFSLERDPWGNYKIFTVKQIGSVILSNIKKGVGNTSDSKYTSASIVTTTTNSNGVIVTQTTTETIEYPIYGLFFDLTGNSDKENVYKLNTGEEDDYVYWYNESNGTVGGNPDYEVYIKSSEVSIESIMSELYYRNKAGHSYADYDSNKITYQVDNSTVFEEGALDPNTLYDINYVLEYVWENWYHYSSEVIDLKRAILDKGGNSGYSSGGAEAYELIAELLTENGGPFEYDTVIYLGTKEHPYQCSGSLGHMYTHPSYHAPLSAHFLYGSYINSIITTREVVLDYPIFKDITGKRPMLPKEDQLNPDKIVTLLNIKATVKIEDKYNQASQSDTYYNSKASFNNNTTLIDAAQYESVVAVTTKWNMQFLTSDFWKHGQAGIFDIADDIYPTYWYGKQHPFEFEFVVVDDPSTHKIFTNLELIANKAKPESFHYEVVGETYDFAKDKVNMYFRQEAMKALWQYNGADIEYDRNFLKVLPVQQPKSADFVHRYYARLDTINDIEDYYVHVTYPTGYDYRHLSGGEIVYYPTRLEYRVWNHTMAVDLNDLDQDSGRSIIAANCLYLEDRWKVTINPILVCYKNEYTKGKDGTYIKASNSTWAESYDSSQKLPLLPIMNSPIPDAVKAAGKIDFPGVAKGATGTGTSETELDQTNALYHLYNLQNFGLKDATTGVFNYSPLDTKSWLNDSSIYGTYFGEAQNRKEVDVRDKFVKVRIRYSGEELAIIDFINTIYQISYS